MQMELSSELRILKTHGNLPHLKHSVTIHKRICLLRAGLDITPFQCFPRSIRLEAFAEELSQI